MTTDHTPPETCPGCGAEQAENRNHLQQFGEQFYTCKAVWTTRSGFVYFCVNAFAWAAQHRPLVAELVAALEGYLNDHDDDIGLVCGCERCDYARACIAKAEGSTP